MANKADNAQLQEANAYALETAFPKTELRKAFDSMATGDDSEANANNEKQSAAREVCVLAAAFITDVIAEGSDTETALGKWKSDYRQLTAEMAVAGHKFAETVDGKGDKDATHRLTGYGKNVSSIARGVIEYDITIAEDDSYSDVRKMVTAERAENRDEDVKALAEAKELIRESLKDYIAACGDDSGFILDGALAIDRMASIIKAGPGETPEVVLETDEHEVAVVVAEG